MGLIAIVFAASMSMAATTNERYAAGQVWEYKTRSGDEGSLLKIQSIEINPAFAGQGPIYHISVVGFHFSNPQVQPVLPHVPVSKATLDASVIRLSDAKPDFPDAAAGITEWKRAHGGVFTIPVAQIVDLIDKQTANAGK